MTDSTTDTGAPWRRYLSLTFNVFIWLIVAIDAWYLWPTAFHGSTSMIVVSGHSMEPTYFTGDLVIARKMEPSVGDVIVYAPEGFGGSQIVHRIIGGDAEQGWVMQGDNNDNEDPFTPKGDEIKGVVLVHYANFGRVTVLLLNPMVWAFILLASIVLLVWWSSDSCDEDDDDEDTDTHAHETEPEPEEELDLIDRMVEGAEAAVARMGASLAGVGAAVLASLKRRSSAAHHAMSARLRKAPLYLRTSAMVAVLGLVAVLVPSVASASSLTVNTGGNIFAKSYAPCTNATLGVTYSGTPASGSTYPAIAITGLSGCAGFKLSYLIYDANGPTSVTGSNITVGAGTNTITTNAPYDASKVRRVLVTVNGWPLTNTWTGPPAPLACYPADSVPAPVGSSTCAVAPVAGAQWTEWGSPGSRVRNIYLHVTTDPGVSNAVVTLNLSQSPFPAWTVGSINGNIDWRPVPGYSCAELPILRLYANPSAGGVSKDIYMQLAESPTNFGTGPSSDRICPSP